MTSELQKPSSLNYKRFLKFISSSLPLDYNYFLNRLNSYKTILIHTDSREWEIIKPDIKDMGLTHENLMKLNLDKLKIRDRLEEEKKKETGYSIYTMWKKMKLKSEKVFEKRK